MKNKIISILCIIFLISCIFIYNNVFAYSIPSVDNLYNLPNEEFLNAIYNHSLYDDGNTAVFVYNNNVFFVKGTTSFYFGDNAGLYYAIWLKNTSGTTIYKYTYSSGQLVGASHDYYNLTVQANGGTVYSNRDIYRGSSCTDIFFTYESKPVILYPGISNTAEDLATGTFDYILVTPGSFTSSENIELNIYKDISADGGDTYSQSPLFSTSLTSSSSYYKSVTVEDVTEFWYEIPRANLNIDFKNGNTYLYSLILGGEIIQEIQATVEGLTEEDILNNNFDNLQTSIIESNKEFQETIIESNKEVQESIDKQTEAIEENNKTNKNIFERIGDILSYINPFSENFFAYKLVELIVDGLKSLFIPADDFFGTYFEELNNWFSERLGFLYYPLELLFDLLDRFININFEEPIINIPEIKEPTTEITFIKATSFNFNSLLENSTFSNVHNVYLLIVDAGIYVGLVMLLMKKYEEVMTK